MHLQVKLRQIFNNLDSLQNLILTTVLKVHQQTKKMQWSMYMFLEADIVRKRVRNL